MAGVAAAGAWGRRRVLRQMEKWMMEVGDGAGELG